MDSHQRLSPQDFLDFVAADPQREYATGSRGNRFTCTISGDAIVILRASGTKKRATAKRIEMFCERFNEIRSLRSSDYQHDLTAAASQLVVLADLMLRRTTTVGSVGVKDGVLEDSGSSLESSVSMAPHTPQSSSLAGILADQLERINSEADLGFIYTVVRQRLGQGDFRQGVLRAYSHRCAITGCCDVEVLEAAHIVPWSEEGWQSVANGVLLRADIHALFDCDLIGIDPASGAVRVSTRLRSSEYRLLDGVPVSFPVDKEKSPKVEYLTRRWKRFSGFGAGLSASG